MGRFYQPAQAPQFVEGMYTPPWELIDKKLQENQKGYDEAVATANLFNDIDIQHIDDPILKAEAESLKNYYTGKVGAISEAIQKDPTSWKRNMPQIQKVGQELTNDMKNGRIAELQQQAASYQKFFKDHEEYRKKYGEDFNRGASYYMEQFRKDPLRRGNFEYEQLAAPVDMDKVISEVMKLKASAVETSNGMYIVGTETVPKAQIEMSARNQIMGRPENRGYLQQQVRFKNPDYYNADYEKINPESGGFYERLYRNAATNEVISNEEAGRLQNNYEKEKEIYNKLPKEKRAKAIAPIPPVKVESGAVGRMVDEAVAAGFFEKHTLKSDPVQIAVMNAKVRQSIANADREFKREEANLSRSLEAQKNNLSALNTLRKYIEGLEETDPNYKSAKEQEAKLINATFNIASKTSTGTTTKSNIFSPNVNPVTGEVDESLPTFSVAAPLKLDIPTSMTVLSKNYADDKKAGVSSRNSQIFQEKLKEMKSLISSEKDATKRSRYLKFLDFYKSYAEKGELGDYNIRELAQEFVKSHPTEKAPVPKQISLDRLGALKYYNTIALPYKQRVDHDIYELSTVLGRAVGKVNESLKDLNQAGQTDLVNITEVGSVNLINQIKQNPTAFNFYKRNPKSKEISTKGGVRKIDLNGAKATKAVNYSVGNGDDNAFVVENSDGEYLVVPSSGKSGVSSFVRGVLTSPESIVGGKENPYIQHRAQSYAYEIASELQTRPAVIDAAGNTTYSAPITVHIKGRGDEQLTIVKIDKGSETKYIVKESDGEPIDSLTSTDLYTKYDEEGKVVEKGLADKIRDLVAAQNR